jgi:hypothetical protein
VTRTVTVFTSALVLSSCALVHSNQGVTDTHGHKIKYSNIQKDRKRSKMLRKKGYKKNIFKSGNGGYDKNGYGK